MVAHQLAARSRSRSHPCSTAAAAPSRVCSVSAGPAAAPALQQSDAARPSSASCEALRRSASTSRWEAAAMRSAAARTACRSGERSSSCWLSPAPAAASRCFDRADGLAWGGGAGGAAAAWGSSASMAPCWPAACWEGRSPAAALGAARSDGAASIGPDAGCWCAACCASSAAAPLSATATSVEAEGAAPAAACSAASLLF